MKTEIYPLEKVVINGIAICFGMTQSEVEVLIGPGRKIGNRYYYCNGEAAIDYNENKVEFVEFLGGMDGVYQPMIYGVSVFAIQAEKLVGILKEKNGGKVCDMENGRCYQFADIGIGLYREAVPQEISEMIEEAAAFGNPMTSDEIEYESKRANYFATVGVGIAGYYDDKF